MSSILFHNSSHTWMAKEYAWNVECLTNRRETLAISFGYNVQDSMSILLLWKYQVIFRINLSGLNALNGNRLIDWFCSWPIESISALIMHLTFQGVFQQTGAIANLNKEKLTIDKIIDCYVGINRILKDV